MLPNGQKKEFNFKLSESDVSACEIAVDPSSMIDSTLQYMVGEGVKS